MHTYPRMSHLTHSQRIAGKKGLRTPGRNRPTQPQGPSVPQQPLPQLGASSFGSGASLFPPPNPPSNIPTNAPTHPPNQQGFAFGVQSSSNSTGSVPVNSGFAFTMSQPQSSNSPFTIPQNSSFSFSGVPTMDFDKPAVINNHYASTEDTEVSSSKRQKSKDGNKYSPEEMKVRKELQELMRLKHKNGANGLQRYDPDYYEEMGTAELKSKATGEDVPLWAPGAPTLRKPLACILIQINPTDSCSCGEQPQTSPRNSKTASNKRHRNTSSTKAFQRLSYSSIRITKAMRYLPRLSHSLPPQSTCLIKALQCPSHQLRSLPCSSIHLS